MSLIVKIKKHYKNFSLNVDFLSNGETTGLLGASGTGKTLTLKCIAGIEKPDEGKIILNNTTLFDSDKGINLSPQRRHVGYLFQNYALFPNMTVEQNIACGIFYEKNKTIKKKQIAKIINKMKLDGLEKHHPCMLSGGTTAAYSSWKDSHRKSQTNNAG